MRACILCCGEQNKIMSISNKLRNVRDDERKTGKTVQLVINFTENKTKQRNMKYASDCVYVIAENEIKKQ